MRPAAIRVSHISKTFVSPSDGNRKVLALDDVSLEVRQGEILGLLGPNGAGKTTFLNILSTLLLPDKGEIEILGIRSQPRNFARLRRHFNMSSGYPNYPWSLTVEENLRFYGWLYGLRGKTLKKQMDRLVDVFVLGDYRRRRFEELSSGTKQRLSLAKAFLNDPKILFLDEPTVGLDPDVAVRTREIIHKIMKESGVTVILTTHYMAEAEEMCERIAFIKQGKLLRLATPGELKSAHGKDDLEEVFIELSQSHIGQEVPAAPAPGGTVTVGEVKERPGIWARRCMAFAYRNFLIAVRNVFAYVELIFWPIVSLISIGLMGDFLRLQDKALAFILTGAIAGGILQVTQLDVAYSLLYEIWAKSMKHTFLTPIAENEFLFGSWLIGMARGLIIFILLGVLAVGFFGFAFPPLGVTLIFLAGLFVSSLLLGMLVSFLVLVCGQKADITAWMFAYLFMLLSGIYYPIDTLPPFFAALARLCPVTYFLEHFRQSFGFTPTLDHLLLKGFGLAAVYAVIGLAALRFAFRQARRRGILVRLSE